jgi:hypothetical protein
VVDGWSSPDHARGLPAIPRCFTPGHPYAGSDAIVFVMTIVVALWLWLPNPDVKAPRKVPGSIRDRTRC